MFSGYNKEQIKESLEILLRLEWLGIHIEDTKEEKGSLGLMNKTAYYYSVPESSVIELDDEKFNSRIKTSDGLKLLAKEILTELLIDFIKKEFPDDEEFITDVENNFSDYFKFYAKVRSGEVWNEELGNNRMKELQESVKNGYREI